MKTSLNSGPRDLVAVFLNGATSGSRVFNPLLAELSVREVSTIVFDHPLDQTAMAETASLATRLLEAERILLNNSQRDARVAVVGYSMGGHTAIELAASFGRVKVVVLVAPAAYGDNARELPFGQHFRDAISAPGSWHEASVFRMLGELDARVILAIPEFDAVIPPGITARYQKIVESRPGDLVFDLSGATHDIGAWLDGHTHGRAALANEIVTSLYAS